MSGEQNEFRKRFAFYGGGALALVIALLLWAKFRFDAADTEFRETANTLQQLEAGNPYPNSANVARSKAQMGTYQAALEKLQAELATHVMATQAMAPNEFQIQLLQVTNAVAEAARASKVKLPDNFKLGFDEFSSALPKAQDVPKLARELSQLQLLANLIIESKPDAITVFKRVPPAPAPSAPPTRGASASPPSSVANAVERTTVDFKVAASPSALRKIINQIATANDQFYLLRTLHIKNQNDKGPSREHAPGSAPRATPVTAAAASPDPAHPATPALSFIVGNEHVELAARVELIDFDAVATK